MVRIRGAAEHSRRLKRIMGAGLAREVGEGLFAAGKLIQADARAGADTSVAGTIEIARTGPLKVEVSSGAPDAATQEFGTSQAAAQPFMEPAAARNRAKAVELVGASVSALVSQSKGA